MGKRPAGVRISGGSIRPGFEGGQMPLYRKLPKRGFKNRFRKVYGVLNIGDLSEIRHEGVLDIAVLKALGHLLKILGDGEIQQPVTVRAHAVSETAKNKIETAGGRIEVIADRGQEANIV
jgi:large subunit ribosomal protein L15